MRLIELTTDDPDGSIWAWDNGDVLHEQSRTAVVGLRESSYGGSPFWTLREAVAEVIEYGDPERFSGFQPVILGSNHRIVATGEYIVREVRIHDAEDAD